VKKAPFPYHSIAPGVKQKSKVPIQVKEPLRTCVTETKFDIEKEAKQTLPSTGSNKVQKGLYRITEW